MNIPTCKACGYNRIEEVETGYCCYSEIASAHVENGELVVDDWYPSEYHKATMTNNHYECRYCGAVIPESVIVEALSNQESEN